MTKTLVKGAWYTVTTASTCTVTDANGITLTTAEAGSQAHFQATTELITFSDPAATVLVNPNHAPVAAGNSNGGGGSDSAILVREYLLDHIYSEPTVGIISVTPSRVGYIMKATLQVLGEDVILFNELAFAGELCRYVDGEMVAISEEELQSFSPYLLMENQYSGETCVRDFVYMVGGYVYFGSVESGIRCDVHDVVNVTFADCNGERLYLKTDIGPCDDEEWRIQPVRISEYDPRIGSENNSTEAGSMMYLVRPRCF